MNGFIKWCKKHNYQYIIISSKQGFWQTDIATGEIINNKNAKTGFCIRWHSKNYFNKIQKG